jgi:hypothetical protein
MHSSRLQGEHVRMFDTNIDGGGGVHILTFVSSLQLDLSNRTVVLRNAVLPLYDD